MTEGSSGRQFLLFCGTQMLVVLEVLEILFDLVHRVVGPHRLWAVSRTTRTLSSSMSIFSLSIWSNAKWSSLIIDQLAFKCWLSWLCLDLRFDLWHWNHSSCGVERCSSTWQNHSCWELHFQIFFAVVDHLDCPLKYYYQLRCFFRLWAKQLIN